LIIVMMMTVTTCSPFFGFVFLLLPPLPGKAGALRVGMRAAPRSALF
jgi:hypothetical protein